MNTTLLRSLNGGQGIRQLGQVRITDRAGNVSTFDLTGAQTVDDVLAILQAQPGGAQIQAQLSDSGLGIIIQDSSGGGGSLTIEDVTGTAAQDLKIAGQTTTDVLRGGTLYRQYISGNTLLSDMNVGKGIAAGSFKITDSAGHYTTINVSKSATMRLRDVINLINNSSDNVNVEARISETGDGIEIIDRANGPGQMKIEDSGSTTASDLRIAGTTAVGQDSIDGRASASITLDAAGSLNDLVEKLQTANNLLWAGIINDGSDIAPYRLVITAANSGSRGALAIDTGGVSLSLDTLVQGQDAIAYIGGNGQTGGVQLVSSDNQLRDVIPNVTLSLTGQGGYADVTVSKDVDSLSKQMASVADKINATLSQLNDLTRYSDDASSRGILFGDFTADQLRNSLYDMIGLRTSANGRKLSLSDLGFSIDSTGVAFDEQKFQDVLSADPDGIILAFTDAKSGLWDGLNKQIETLADPVYGLLPTEDQLLLKQEDLYNQRIADLNVLLDSKQAQLYAQFQAMESALAQLQGMQAALASLASLASQMAAYNSSST
jgi:flagellar hook-associated protein 2